MRILVASTIPAFKMTDGGHWWHWLESAEAITLEAELTGHQVEWLAVLQHDARGRDIFAPLCDRLADLEELPVDVGTHWFSIDTGQDAIDGGSRLAAICTGRNLIIDHALRAGHDWIYFADADITAPENILPRLLELHWPVCGAHVPTYCLNGQRIKALMHAGERTEVHGDVQLHWNTAGSLLVARDVFRRVPWRHDPDAGQTDDPATQAEYKRLGYPTAVRHDVICEHHPSAIGPVERRGHDLTVYR